MKACISPSGKLVCTQYYKIIETVHEAQLPNLIDSRANKSLHRLLPTLELHAKTIQKLPVHS